MKQIVLFGEILIDLISNYSRMQFVPSVGGSIFNTVNTIIKMGITPLFISQLGNDLWGKYLLTYMKDIGIDTSFIRILNSFKTPIAFALIDKNGNASYDFYKSYQKYKLSLKELNNFSIFHFGSLYSVIKQNSSIINKLLKIAKKERAIISYDPNYRKNFTNNEIKTAISNMQKSHIIKASIEDIKSIFGIHDIKDVFKIFNKFNSIITIITLGKEGACASILGKPFIKIDNKKVSVVDTIGAGDNFTSGILFFLYKNNIDTIEKLKSINEDTLYNMTNFANSLAVESVKHKGAALKKIKINKIIKQFNFYS